MQEQKYEPEPEASKMGGSGNPALIQDFHIYFAGLQVFFLSCVCVFSSVIFCIARLCKQLYSGELICFIGKISSVNNDGARIFSSKGHAEVFGSSGWLLYNIAGALNYPQNLGIGRIVSVFCGSESGLNVFGTLGTGTV